MRPASMPGTGGVTYSRMALDSLADPAPYGCCLIQPHQLRFCPCIEKAFHKSQISLTFTLFWWPSATSVLRATCRMAYHFLYKHPNCILHCETQWSNFQLILGVVPHFIYFFSGRSNRFRLDIKKNCFTVKTLAQIALRADGCPILAEIQGQDGWSSEHPDLAVDVLVQCMGIGLYDF